MVSKTERILNAQAHAQNLGGSCLSSKYERSQVKLQWRCKLGHQWDATYGNVVCSGSWCQRCAGKAKHTLEEAQQVAQKLGGSCLASAYKNLKTPLKWSCSQDHQWLATLSDVLHRASWCPECSSLIRTTKLQDFKTQNLNIRAQSIASKHQGKFKSASKGSYVWNCAEGHEWITRSLQYARQYWCVECSEIARRDTRLQGAQQMAELYSGQCLSTKFSTTEKMKWRCSEGHSWSSRYTNIRDGSWCPRCRTIGRREEFCRQVLEHLVGKPFERVRPTWLRSPKGNCLELDGYNEELQLAFEHQGIQHYEDGHFKTRRRNGKLSFKDRLIYDAIKVQVCKDRNIELLVIPYTVLVPDLELWTRSELLKLGIPLCESQVPFRFKTQPKSKRKTKKLSKA